MEWKTQRKRGQNQKSTRNSLSVLLKLGDSKFCKENLKKENR